MNSVDGRDGHTDTVPELRDVQASPAFFACYLPARRAAGIGPMVALRQD